MGSIKKMDTWRLFEPRDTCDWDSEGTSRDDEERRRTVGNVTPSKPGATRSEGTLHRVYQVQGGSARDKEAMMFEGRDVCDQESEDTRP